jgi:ribonuclease P protein component
VLPRPRRVTRPEDFRAVLRRGRRAGRRRLVVHALPGDAGTSHPSRAGLVVGKVVGPSVVRHRVSRRLRHLLRDRLETLDVVAAGTDLVVRAQPAAAGATSAELAEDLDAALARLGLGAAPVQGRKR